MKHDATINNPTAIPIVIGENRLRGNSTGAMVDDGFGDDNLGCLRKILMEEATAVGVEPTRDWMNTAVRQTLTIYERAHAAWLADKKDSIGHVFEATLPSGRTLLMGDRRILARLFGHATS